MKHAPLDVIIVGWSYYIFELNRSVNSERAISELCQYCIRRAVLLGVSRKVLVDLSGHALEPTRSSVACEMTADTPRCVEIIQHTFIRTYKDCRLELQPLTFTGETDELHSILTFVY
jgi:hypothetical protein